MTEKFQKVNESNVSVVTFKMYASAGNCITETCGHTNLCIQNSYQTKGLHVALVSVDKIRTIW